MGNLLPRHRKIFEQSKYFAGIQVPSATELEPLDKLLTKNRSCEINQKELNFLEVCLRMNPSERYTCSELLKHAYFTRTTTTDKSSKVCCKVQDIGSNLPGASMSSDGLAQQNQIGPVKTESLDTAILAASQESHVVQKAKGQNSIKHTVKSKQPITISYPFKTSFTPRIRVVPTNAKSVMTLDPTSQKTNRAGGATHHVFQRAGMNNMHCSESTSILSSTSVNPTSIPIIRPVIVNHTQAAANTNHVNNLPTQCTHSNSTVLGTTVNRNPGIIVSVQGQAVHQHTEVSDKATGPIITRSVSITVNNNTSTTVTDLSVHPSVRNLPDERASRLYLQQHNKQCTNKIVAKVSNLHFSNTQL